MIVLEFGATRVDEALRVVRALGAHRYVAGSLHLIHAFAFAGMGDVPGLEEVRRWAETALSDPTVDPESRDERLWRRSSDAEMLSVLDAYWAPGPKSAGTREALAAMLDRHGFAVPAHNPFDESVEEDLHPLVVDAGWELLPLAELDAERHKGAIEAFGTSLAFQSARFEEEEASVPVPHLVELPALGAVELLRGVDDDGVLRAPLVAWAQGNETYLDYVLRGVRRAAKLRERD